MSTVSENELDNLLVWQKNHIHKLINEYSQPVVQDGFETGNMYIPHLYIEQMRSVLAQLTILQPLWIAAHYSYKGREFCDIISPLIRYNFEVLDNRAKSKLAEIEVFLNQVQTLRDKY